MKKEIEVLKEIRKWRKAQGISIKELSKMTGIDRERLSLIERGECNTTLGTVERILGALDLRLVIDLPK